MSKKHNFSAGPCILPDEVFEKAAAAVRELDGTGLSLIEISHRSPEFVAIMDKARDLVRELLAVPDSHEILFLQGGASLGFYMGALNFMKEKNGRGAYVDTGTWSAKAIKEAKKLGEVDVVASSKDNDYRHIPKGFDVAEGSDYLHITSNNTIFGTQYKEFPSVEVSMLADMSSDIFSRPIEVEKFDLIYAGAQKNMGPAGTTLYIVNRDKIGRTGRDLPSMLDFEVHIGKDSMFNTPPVFAVYTSMLTLEWIKENGGVAAMQRRNADKAKLLYGEIDRNPLFEGTTVEEDRSVMNATFRLKDEASHAERFDRMWKEAGINGLKGHRSVGGYRASMYNAMPQSGVQALVDVMRELEQKG